MKIIFLNLILATVIVSQILVRNIFAQDNRAIIFVYPKGIYAMCPVNSPIAVSELRNAGFTGVFIHFAWNYIEQARGQHSWGDLDNRVQEATDVGLEVVLGIRNGPEFMPEWLKQEQGLKKVTLITTNHYRKDLDCKKFEVPVFWDPVFHQARIDFIQSLGMRYAKNPGVVAVTVSFANFDTCDWFIPHENKEQLLKECPGTDYDNAQAWRRAGWDEEQMLEIGKQIIDATAAAFPCQSLKLAIGASGSGYDLSATGLVERAIQYGFQKYPGRFFAQVNRLKNSVPLAADLPKAKKKEFVLFKILQKYSPQIGLQMGAAVTNGAKDNCRQNAGQQPCQPFEVMKKSIEIALSYHPHFLEFWPIDSVNPELSSLFKKAAVEINNSR